MRRWVICAAAVWVAVASTFAADAASSPVQRYLDGLKSLGLGQLLEQYCARALTLPGIEPALKANLTVELAAQVSFKATRTLDADTRRAEWQRADALVTHFLESNPNYGGGEIVRYRWVGELLARAQFTAKLSAALPDDAALAEDTLNVARSAVETMTELRKEVAEQVNNAGARRAKGSGALSLDKLVNLSTASDYRLGNAWLAVARVAKDKEEKEKAISNADALLKQFAEAKTKDPVVIESRIARAELMSLRNMSKQAIDELRLLRGSDFPKNYQAQANMLLGQLLLEQGPLQEAVDVLGVPKDERVPGAEWDLMLIEALLRRSTELASSARAKADQLQDQALKSLDEVEAQYGRYWAQRGETILAQHGRLDESTVNLGLLERLGNVFRARQELKKSLTAYDRGAKLAKEQKKSDVACRLEYAGGNVAFQLEDYPSAAERLTAVSREWPKSEVAAQALLTASYAWARQYSKSSDAQILAKYRAVLEEHLEKFPESTMEPEIHWLLGGLAEREQKWEEAITQYRSVWLESPYFPRALQSLVGICHDRLVLGTAQRTPEQEELLKKTIRVLQYLHGEPPASLTDSTEGYGALLMARYVLARLLSLPTIGQQDEAIEVLRGVLDGDPQPGELLKPRVWQALLELYVEKGAASEAAGLITAEFPGLDQALMRVLARFDPQAEALPEPKRQAQVAVIEAAAERLLAKADQLPERDRFNVRLMQGQALAAKGSHPQAQEVFRRLLQEQLGQRDPRVFISLAKSQFANQQFADSMRSWKVLMSGYRRGGPEWLAGLYYVISCQAGLGERDKALRTLNVAEQLYPSLGNAAIKKRYEELRQQLSSQ